MNNIVDEYLAHSSSFVPWFNHKYLCTWVLQTRVVISYPKMIFGNELLSWHHKGHFLRCAATADRLGGTLRGDNLTSGRKISGVSPLILASAIANSISQQ